MPEFLSLTLIERKAPEEVLGGLRAEASSQSILAAETLVRQAKRHGISLRDYLRLAIDPTKSNRKEQFEGMDGYEAALCFLNLPVRDDFNAGITLDLASDTFNTYPGTRALFPEVVDDLVQWAYRQDQIENIANLVGSTRTIAGVEMITTVVNDAQGDYQKVGVIAEMANIPVHSIRSSERSVKMYKIGGGYRTSYEFSRRARLDMLTPYVNRISRELERSKVSLATDILVNGDGVHAAAPVVDQSSLNGGSVGTATNGTLSYKHLLAWLVTRAKAGTPIDTVVGNWDAYIEWLLMFAVPATGSNDRTAAENMARAGFKMAGVPLLDGTVNFAVSSDAPASKLVGYTKGETLEELVEAGSLIDEQLRAPNNQTISYYKTEVSGPRIVFGDTRSIFNYAA